MNDENSGRKYTEMAFLRRNYLKLLFYIFSVSCQRGHKGNN